MRLLKSVLIVAPLALALVGCGSRDGENAADYAGQLGMSGQDNAALAQLPKAAPDGRKAVRYSVPYQGNGPNGVASSMQILSDGSFTLKENGRTFKGTYNWLSDGKRLRLKGVSFRPIVLIAQNGALYRMTNENVPLDDLTPDRLYSSPPQ